jgi:beta-glucosidase
LTWEAAYEKAALLVGNMTLDEMANITYGIPGYTACSGASGGIPRFGYPGMCFQDAGNGVRGQDGVNSYPSGIHIGASWNRDLAYTRGLYMGAEFRRKGVDVALGPVAGPIGRVAEGGRNWEGAMNA